MLERTEREAAARGDRRVAGRALAGQAEQFARLGRPRDAEQRARRGLGLAQAGRDTAGMLRALRWLAVSVGSQGRSAEMADWWRRALRIGTASGDLPSQAFAHLGLGHHALAGEHTTLALEEFRKALPLFERLGDAQWGLWTVLALGMAHDRAGDHDRARTCYHRVILEADRVRNPGVRASASNNLAVMEYRLGDPAAAAEGFRTAYHTERDSALLTDRVTEGTNLAICQAELGRYRDALALLDTLLQVSHKRGFITHQGKILLERGDILRQQGRWNESARCLRQALDLSVTGLVKDQVESATGLARTLAEADSLAAAERVLDRVARRWAALRPFPYEAELDMARGELRARAGRPEEAVGLLRRAERRFAARSFERARLDALVALGRAYLALGERDSARVVLERGAGVWERARDVMSDLEWRERFGAQSRALHEALLRLSLASPDRDVAGRAAEAFDVLQRYKARTLRERMLGPTARDTDGALANPGPAITARELQRGVLHEGECFIDVFVGADTTLLFALTRDSLRVAGVSKGRGALGARLARWHAMLASAPERTRDGTRGAALASSALRFASELLAPFDDLLGASVRLIVCPDGELHLVPFALLTGTRAGEARHAALEVTCVPSASVFAQLRDRARAGSHAGGTALALAADSADARPRMRGAVAEVRWFGASFADVDLRLPGAGDARLPTPGELRRYAVLHFAAHTSVDDQHPWRSGVLLAPAAPGERYLRASRIAASPLAARLAVLSGCESAGGRVLSGEGVQGLTAAFLCAGVPAVVASLWPVDDRATEQLMKEFYGRLARGERVATALSGAQRALRRRSATADPFFWAGFVLVGDADVRVRLRSRQDLGWRVVGPAGLALAALFAVAWWWSRRAGRRIAVTDAPGGALTP
jgi:CHAT domain-containing protein/tetratricopeptide (TPR) repeat protein